MLKQLFLIPVNILNGDIFKIVIYDCIDYNDLLFYSERLVSALF